MGISVLVRSGAKERSFPIDSAEIAALSKVAKSKDAVGSFEVLFGLGIRHVHRDAILLAIESCLSAASHDSGLEFVSVSGTFSDGMPFGNAKGISGIRIAGELFAIKAGIGRCILQKIRVKEDGRGEIVSEKELVGVNKLETDNLGVILIKRRRRPTQIQKLLRGIKQLLKATSGDADVIVEVG